MAANVIFCRAKFCRLLFSRSSVTHLSPLSSQTAVGGVQTPFPGAASAFPYGTMPYASNFFGGAQGTETAVGDADANNANGEQKPGARKSRGGTNSSAPQDERELKRQRRKQSNRESARRSRLRKQAECEELGSRVGGLTEENEKLRGEVKRLFEQNLSEMLILATLLGITKNCAGPLKRRAGW